LFERQASLAFDWFCSLKRAIPNFKTHLTEQSAQKVFVQLCQVRGGQFDRDFVFSESITFDGKFRTSRVENKS
jgi:hypothetical protein